MITDNTKGPKGSTLTFDLWLKGEGSAYVNLPEAEQREKYEEWLKGLGSKNTDPTLTDSQFTDNTESTLTTELQQNKPTNNIDLMGATDTFTQLGIATGNQNVTKAGVLGSSAVKAMQQIKATKGLTGFAKTSGVTGAIGGVADTADQLLFGNQAAKNSDLTNGMNSMYDSISSGIMTMGPYGAMIGGAMKIGGLLSDGLTALGVGTDQMTTTDLILDSKFLKLTPAGLINGIFSSTTDKFAVDNNVRSQMAGSYGGAYKFMDDAASKANKSYGLFSGGAKREANEKIREAKIMQSKVGNIGKEASDKRSIALNSSDLLAANYSYNLMGGYDQRYIRAAKEGSKLDRIKKINLTLKKGGQVNRVINVETKEIEWKPVIIEDTIPEFKNGGNIEQAEWAPVIVEYEHKSTVDLFKEGGSIEKEWVPKIEIIEEVKTLQTGGEMPDFSKAEEEDEEIFTLEDYIEQKILERTQEAIKKATTRKKPYMFKNKKWKNCIATATDNYGVPICLRNSDFAANPLKWGFEELLFGDTVDTLPEGVLILDYNKPKQPNIPGHTVMLVSNKEGEKPLYSYSSGDNTPESMHNQVEYGFYRWDDKIKPRAYRYIGTPTERKTWEEEYNELYKPFMKKGGKTEETEEKPLSNQQNVIPEGALHARLHHMDNAEELTKKGIPVIDNNGDQLAEIELNEIIFNLEVTKKLEELCKDGSDEAAIEAGKLLVQEILFNTEDRTNLINSLKKGGKIDGNVS